MKKPGKAQTGVISVPGFEPDFRTLLILILIAVMLFGIFRGEYIEAWSNASTL